MPLRFVAVGGLKGGSGRTTLTANAGAGLARRGLRVAVLDLDPLRALTYHLAEQHPEPGIAEALEGIPVERAMHRTAVAGLSLLPGSPNMAAWDRRPQRLPEALGRVFAAMPAELDAVLIDLPPSAGAIVCGCLEALPGGRVIAPVPVGGLDLLGLADLLDLIERLSERNPDLALVGVAPWRVRRTRLARDVLEALEAEYGKRLLPGVRDSVVVAQAALSHRSVHDEAPRSGAAADLEALTRAVASKVLRG